MEEGMILLLIVFILVLFLIIIIFIIFFIDNKNRNKKSNKNVTKKIEKFDKDIPKNENNSIEKIEKIKTRKLVIKDDIIVSESVKSEESITMSDSEDYSDSNDDSSEKSYSEDDTETATVIDACNYSKYTLYLTSTNVIIVDEKDNNDDMVEKTSNISINCITVFNGYLYALHDGKLYRLDNSTIDYERWVWIKEDIDIKDIISFSSTIDRKYIWLQKKNEGLLLDSKFNIVEQVKTNKKRNYGINIHNYIVFENDGSITIKPTNEVYENVKDAILNHKGEVFILRKNQKDFNKIRLLNWKSYYL